MKKLMIGMLATMGCLGAMAVDEIVFPDLMGDGVLTSDASWGEGGVPTDKRPNITSAGDYSIGRDISFAGLRFANFEKAGTATVTATGRKVTFGASISVRHEHSVRFVGGLYDFQGKYASAYGNWDQPNDQNWEVSAELDGCVFTNMASFCTGYYTKSGWDTWTLKNGAGMYVDNNFWLGYADNGHNRMEVLSGSRLVVGDNASFPREGASSVGSVLRISGSGSYFKTGSNFNYGAREFDLVVEDGARASIGGGYWYFNNKGNTIRVDGATSTMALGSLYASAGSVSNRIEATDGATLTLLAVHLNTCEAFGVVVSNATASLGASFSAESGQSPSNCYIRVEGEDAVFTSDVNGGLLFSGFATDFLAADGASASLGKSDKSVTLGGTACAFRARGEGTTLGITTLGVQGTSNRIEVAEGATLNLTDVWFEGCRDVEILVSNATAVVNGNDKSISARGNVPSSDTTIRITGKDARFTSGQGFRLGGVRTRMRIEDEASASVGSYYSYLSGTSNSISVAGAGSSATITASYPSGADHFYEVADGGALTVGRVYLQNVDGFGLVVSNGTMNMSGFSAGDGKTPTNLYVAIQGDCPILNVGQYGLNFERGLELRYSLPLAGYADGGAPIRISPWCPGDETAKIVIENLEEIQKHLQEQGIRKQTYRLIHVPNGIQGMTATRLNGLLPKGCSVNWKDGYLELTVKVDLGCLLIVR